MDVKAIEAMTNLTKALEAGNYDAAPGTLTQGSALQIEDLSPVMNNLFHEKEELKLQKILGVESCKATTVQFNRKLSYGVYGASAQIEGNIGVEQTSDVVRITQPMAFYSSTRRVTVASTFVATVDGKKSDDREAEDAADLIAADVEFDCFKGLDEFSNGGVFDGSPQTVGALPNIHGVFLQIRQSDGQVNARDAMFAEYGNDESVVLSAGGAAITQDIVESIALRSSLNHGVGKRLLVDPVALSDYNRISFGKERIVLAGAPQTGTGSNLEKQWVSNGGTVTLESSIFLRGKQIKRKSLDRGPGTPVTLTNAVLAAGTSLDAGTYIYRVTAGNEIGESAYSVTTSATVVDGDKVTLTIGHPVAGTGTRFFNVYRSAPDGSAESSKYIGRVLKSDIGATTAFVDLNNKAPGSVTCVLIQEDTMKMKELAPYSRIKLGVSDLSMPEGHFRFVTNVMYQPRKNVLLDNVKGTIS